MFVCFVCLFGGGHSVAELDPGEVILLSSAEERRQLFFHHLFRVIMSAVGVLAVDVPVGMQNACAGC